MIGAQVNGTEASSSESDANATTTMVPEEPADFIQLDAQGPYDRSISPEAELVATNVKDRDHSAYAYTSNYEPSLFNAATSKKLQPMSFAEALNWKFVQRAAPQGKGSMVCGSSAMGDPAPGQKTQCFCEPLMPTKPAWCAEEGGNCNCKG